MNNRAFKPYHLAAVLVFFMGIENILSAWLIHHPTRVIWLKQYLPWIVIRGSWLGGILAGTVQIFLSWSLGRRKWLAWRIAIAMLLIDTIAGLLHGLHYENALINLLLILVLLVLKPWFTATSDPPSVRHGLVILAGVSIFTYLYGLTGLYLLDMHFHQHFSLMEASRQTIAYLLWLKTPALEHPNLLARWFLDSLAVMQIGGFIYGLAMVLRPVIYRQTTLVSERKKAAKIAEKYGHSSLVYITLLPDKSYFFSSTGKSYAAYTVVSNVAVVLGDPVGPDEDIGLLIAEFDELCAGNDWYPAFYQVLPDYLPLYRARGYKILKIGEEAIVDLPGFSLSGKDHKSLRNAVNRLSKKGYTTQLVTPPLNDSLLASLMEVSNEWLSIQQGGEKKFSLGWFDPHYIKSCPVMLVKDAKGDIQAFANIIPEYQIKEATIDLMRRRGGESGLMDMMFVSLIEYFKTQGYNTFNLGLCPLAGVGEHAGASLQERAAHFFYQHFNYLYGFKGLRKFKEKFSPRWEPRYLVYPHPLVLPKIAFAIVTANAGGSLWSYVQAWWEKRRLTGQ